MRGTGNVTENTLETTQTENAKILMLQKQFSQANRAKEQNLYEIIKLNNDTHTVLDEEQDQRCFAIENDKTDEMNQMRIRFLSHMKGIEREKRWRNNSICGVKGVNSGFGTVRARSESEIFSKKPQYQTQRSLPTLSEK